MPYTTMYKLDTMGEMAFSEPGGGGGERGEDSKPGVKMIGVKYSRKTKKTKRRIGNIKCHTTKEGDNACDECAENVSAHRVRRLDLALRSLITGVWVGLHRLALLARQRVCLHDHHLVALAILLIDDIELA